jgi:hypothetical protein
VGSDEHRLFVRTDRRVGAGEFGGEFGGVEHGLRRCGAEDLAGEKRLTEVLR